MTTKTDNEMAYDHNQEMEQGDHELQKFNFLRSKATTPLPRFYREGWRKTHLHHIKEINTNKSLHNILLGDSIIKGLSRYPKIWHDFFEEETINCGIGGDKVEHVLWRTENIFIPPNIKNIIIHCGTNNVDTNASEDIANGILCSAINIVKLYKHTNIYVISLLPRDCNETKRRKNITSINNLLHLKCASLRYKQIQYIEQEQD